MYVLIAYNNDINVVVSKRYEVTSFLIRQQDLKLFERLINLNKLNCSTAL